MIGKLVELLVGFGTPFAQQNVEVFSDMVETRVICNLAAVDATDVRSL